MNQPILEPGIKLGTHLPASAPAEALRFLRELGLEDVRVHFDVDQDDPALVRSVCDRFAAAGLRIYSAVYLLYRAPEIAFALPGRDAAIERWCRFLRTLGACGIHTLDYDFFLYAPLPATGEAATRGCATRCFDLADAQARPALVSQPCTAEQMWERYAYLMRALLPTAEAAGVRLALHPDDPPLPELLGVPRLFSTMGGLERAMQAFDSPAWGVLFCVGTWAEGGAAMGASIEEAIRFLAARGKLLNVHLRNVDAPLPHFVETFLDNGYVDIAAVLRVLRQVDYRGLLIPDHFPAFAGDADQRASLAYAIGYLRGLLQT